LPQVKVEPNDVSLNESESIEFVCNAKGRPTPKVNWNTTGVGQNITVEMKESIHFSESNETEVNEYTLKSATAFVEHRLIIKNVQRHNVGFIFCTAENIVGKAVDKAFVQVFSPPIIEYIEVKKKFYWCISYKISGFPPANRTWFFNGKPLVMDDNIEDLKSAWSILNPYGDEEGCLQIKQATHVNDGIYELRAFNSHGSAKKSIEARFHIILPNQNQPSVKNMKISPPSTPFDIDDIGGNKEVSVSEENKYIFIIIGVVILIVVMVTSAALLVKKRRHLKNLPLSKSERIPLNSKNIVENPNYFDEERRLGQALGVRVIPHEKLSYIQHLGEGAFGKVFLATVDFLTPDEPTTLVAVKTLKNVAESEMKDDFEREAQLLSSLSHPNIVTFHGIALDGDMLMMVFEYMEFGDLNNFLRTNGPDNVLLSNVGRQAILPVRWMSPESILYRKFTTESDIWSFGVVLWEIFSYGKQPFYELSNHEVIEYITNGKILSQPDTCLPEVYEIMLLCFKQNPAKRAPFSELQKSIQTLIKKQSDNLSYSEV
ncbi:BDNF/NT-3 growth factors receptor-like protein, partial [Dinothrombium tinctorium]